MTSSRQEYSAPRDGSVLYKYRHLDGKHRDRTERIITDAEIYFASAESFNDPWDSRVPFHVGSSREQQAESREQQAERFDSLLARRRQQLSAEQRRIAVDQMLVAARDPERLSTFERKMQDRIYTLGICSLSADPSNILLWSHYANSHMGLCLGFTRSSPFFATAMKITYQEEYAQVDPFTDLGASAHTLLTTKAQVWQYERERRIFDLSGPGLKGYPREALRLVILGCRLSDMDRQAVISWTQQCEHPIDIVQAKRSSASFSLTFTKIQ